MNNRPYPEDDEPKIAIGPPRHPREPEVLDGYDPLPGNIKALNKPPASITKKRKGDESEFSRYAQLLVQYRGDAVKALAVLHECSEEKAEENLIPWRDEIHAKGKDSGLISMLKRHEIDTENQVALLKGWAYSGSAAPSLKAVELIQQMTGKQKSRREGMSAEDAVRLALATIDPE